MIRSRVAADWEPHPALYALLVLMEAHAVDEAAELVLDQLTLGQRPDDLIRDLLCPAQAEVGERWHRNEWTVSQEHQATAVCDAALHRLVSAAPPPRRRQGDLVVACAPGDWHTLPSRMAAEILRLHGWRVTFAGATLPMQDLSRWLARSGPDGFVITCSMPSLIRGMHALVGAADEAGVSVVVGGLGMGTDEHRARALGVRWSADLSQLEQVLAAPAPAVNRDSLIRRLREHDDAALCREQTVSEALDELHEVWPPLAQLEAWQLPFVENIGQLFDFLSAAALTADPRVIIDYLDWLSALLAARAVPTTAIAATLDCLATALPSHLTASSALLTKLAHAVDGH